MEKQGMTIARLGQQEINTLKELEDKLSKSTGKRIALVAWEDAGGAKPGAR